MLASGIQIPLRRNERLARTLQAFFSERNRPTILGHSRLRSRNCSEIRSRKTQVGGMNSPGHIFVRERPVKPLLYWNRLKRYSIAIMGSTRISELPTIYWESSPKRRKKLLVISNLIPKDILASRSII